MKKGSFESGVEERGSNAL